MRIAQLAPLVEAVPPGLYGGTERVVSWLTEELVEMGHEVTLFAPGDSITNAALEACSPKALRLDCSQARYVIGRDGIIVYADINADYRQHPDPCEIVPLLREMSRAPG